MITLLFGLATFVVVMVVFFVWENQHLRNINRFKA
jgi:hypothetical protein